MKKLKVLKRFYDLQSKSLRVSGDEFTTDKERAETLVSSSFCVVIEDVEKKPIKRSRKKSGE